MNDYTIIDGRNKTEIKEQTITILKGSLSIPLDELRENINIIPTGNTLVVHRASGYRNASAGSLIQSSIGNGVKSLL